MESGKKQLAEMDKICININKIKLAGYVYLALPVLVFFIGWLKIPFALLFSGLLIAALVFSFRGKDFSAAGRSVKMTRITLLLLILIALLWVYMSGIGGFVWQREDWHMRNANIRDLSTMSWPVIYEDTGDGLVYYLCFYMVPALVGKIAGFEAASFTLFIWSFIGVFLIMLMTAQLFTDDEGEISLNKTLVVAAFIVGWSGLNVVGQFIAYLRGLSTMGLEAVYGWSIYQYTPNNALLEWVFNQAIPAWMAAVLFLDDRREKTTGNYAFLVMLMIPYAPFPAVGIMPLLLADIFKTRFRGVFSRANVLSVLAVLPVFAAYYSCNAAVSGDSASGIGIFIRSYKDLPYQIMVLIVFLSVMVLPYVLLIFKENRNDYMFLVVSAELLIIPLIRIGPTRDFIMRGSIVPLFVLMYYVMKTVFDSKYRVTKRFAVLCVCLVLSAYSACADFYVTAKYTLDPDIPNVADRIGTTNYMGDEEWNKYMGDGTAYFVSEPEKRFFYRVFAN